MTSSPQRIQRTLAILRGAAADEVGRRSVEARITESGFDLLNERFIDSEEGLVAGPAVVLVLQRHRAISVWLSIVSVTKEEYGEGNLEGCATVEQAEQLIEVLFPPGELKAAMLSPTPSITTTTTTTTTSSSFRARDLPATHGTPDIAPRMSKAAMLRMGMSPPPPVVRKRSSTVLSGSDTTPGVSQRTLTAAEKPKSIAAPLIAPRATKASALRTGEEQVERPKPARKTSSGTAGRSETADFADTPGHRRTSLSIAVASTRAPTIAPRQTKASALRTGGETMSSPAGPARERIALGTAERARPAGTEHTPGYKRETLQFSVASTKAPTVAPRQTKASALRTGGARPVSAMDRVMTSVAEGAEPKRAESPVAIFAGVPGHKRESVKVASSKAPTITPRANKSATLRANVGGVNSPAGVLKAQPNGTAPRPTWN